MDGSQVSQQLRGDPVRVAKASCGNTHASSSIQGLEWKQKKSIRKQDARRKSPVPPVCLPTTAAVVRAAIWRHDIIIRSTSPTHRRIQHAREFSLHNTHRNQNQRPQNDTRRCSVSSARLHAAFLPSFLPRVLC